MAMAQRQGRPMVFLFKAIWCPPCNHLDATLLAGKQWKSLARHFVFVKVDADHKDAWELKSKYAVKGYPTIVITDPEGMEQRRWEGLPGTSPDYPEFFQALGGLSPKLRGLSPKSQLSQENHQPQVTDMDHLVHSLIEEKKFSEALALLNDQARDLPATKTNDLRLLVLSQQEPEKYLKTGFLESNDIYQRFQMGLEGWKQDFRINGKQDQQWEESWFRFLESFDSSSEGTTSSPQKPDLYTIKDIYLEFADAASDKTEDLGSDPLANQIKLNQIKDLSKKYFEKALAILKNFSKKNPHDRGSQLELAYCLKRLERWEEVEKLYQKLCQQYPSEFTFYHAYSKFLKERGQLSQALKYSGLSLRYSYGDNKLRTYLLRSQILALQKKGKLALQELKAALKTVPVLPSDPNVRTHKYVMEIKKQIQELEK